MKQINAILSIFVEKSTWLMKLCINRITLGSVGEVKDGRGDGGAHEFGTVEGEGGEGVESGILLWELEWLMALTIRGEVGDVGTGVVAIIATRGGHEPAAVAGEGRIGLGADGVEVGEADRAIRTRETVGSQGVGWEWLGQIDGKDVGLMMPDVETTVGSA